MENDVVYMRFFKNGKIVRVARMDYQNRQFLGAHPHGMYVSEISDPVWRGLLEGKTVEDILSDFASANGNLGESPQYIKDGIPRTFHIEDLDEDKYFSRNGR